MTDFNDKDFMVADDDRLGGNGWFGLLSGMVIWGIVIGYAVLSFIG